MEFPREFYKYIWGIEYIEWIKIGTVGGSLERKFVYGRTMVSALILLQRFWRKSVQWFQTSVRNYTEIIGSFFSTRQIDREVHWSNWVGGPARWRLYGEKSKKAEKGEFSRKNGHFGVKENERETCVYVRYSYVWDGIWPCDMLLWLHWTLGCAKVGSIRNKGLCWDERKLV